jgi:hypothetical protein
MFGLAGHNDSWVKISSNGNTIVFKVSNIARITESNGMVTVKLNDGYTMGLEGYKLDDVLVKMAIKLD